MGGPKQPVKWDMKQRAAGPVTVLELSGRIVLGSASDTLDARLQELVSSGCQALLVDFSRVEQIDSRGLKALVRGFTSMRKRDGELKLLKPTGMVREVLDVTRLLTVIETFEDEETALRSFTR